MAPKGQTFWHLPQPIHAAEQALRATPPLSLLTQEMNTRRPLTPLFRSSITFLGHAFTQAPHAVHFSSSTSGMPVSVLIFIASN